VEDFLHSTPTVKLSAEKPPRLNIGCGTSPLPKEDGWINTDYRPGDGIDDVFDANERWPYPGEMFHEVRSDHVLEHLSDHRNYFREAWRVLKPKGSMTLRLPYGWHSASWWDLTHLRPWIAESFAGLQPGYVTYSRNLQHDQPVYAFWIRQVVLILEPDWAWKWRYKLLRPYVRWAAKHFINVVQEIIVEATKTTADDARSTAQGGVHHPVVVPCSFGAFEHHYYGQPSDGLAYHKLIIFDGHGPKAIAGH